jgi:Concanavalin A-like lectin/glucanases superfamily
VVNFSPRRSAARWGFLVTLALLWPATSNAQPFDDFFVVDGPAEHGYARIPHSAALNQSTAITVEAWVRLNSASSTGEDCRSIAGKNYLQAWWLGRCNGQLRSYFRGGSEARTGGVIPDGRWTHVAAVFDGVRHKHYINGELVLEAPAGGPPTTSTAELRIGSDVSWQFSPKGAIDEVRIWSIARTTAEIRASLNVRIRTPQAGLVGVWPLELNGQDVVGTLDGVMVGDIGFSGPATSANCGSNTATTLCLNDFFRITARFRTGASGTAESQANVATACNNDGSGLFWFFNADNWEVMVKSINGCGLNNRHWLFSAATTNVFYRMEVTDVRVGETKIFFNYPGPPAPAVTDTNAFATCP